MRKEGYGEFARASKGRTVGVTQTMETQEADPSGRHTVYIRHIFALKPMAALALLICMGAIIALFRLNRRRPQQKGDRFLIAFLGLLTIYEALKLLKNSGFVSITMNSTLDDALELLVAATCLVSAIMLGMSRINYLDIESAVRLARAAPPRSAHPERLSARELSTLDTLTWSIPRLSDGAFKLLAVLCLRPEASNGRVPVGVTDIQLKLGKSKEELERYLVELQATGTITMQRHGETLDIEIVTQISRAPGGAADVPPAMALSASRT